MPPEVRPGDHVHPDARFAHVRAVPHGLRDGRRRLVREADAVATVVLPLGAGGGAPRREIRLCGAADVAVGVPHLERHLPPDAGLHAQGLERHADLQNAPAGDLLPRYVQCGRAAFQLLGLAPVMEVPPRLRLGRIHSGRDHPLTDVLLAVAGREEQLDRVVAPQLVVGRALDGRVVMDVQQGEQTGAVPAQADANVVIARVFGADHLAGDVDGGQHVEAESAVAPVRRVAVDDDLLHPRQIEDGRVGIPVLVGRAQHDGRSEGQHEQAPERPCDALLHGSLPLLWDWRWRAPSVTAP